MLKPYRTFICEVANTILSDINEIYCGYVINGNKWYDADAKKQYEMRANQSLPEEVEDAKGKAVAMAREFLLWASQNGYGKKVVGVWWTARPNSMTTAFGEYVDQRKNPTDILVKFNSGPSKGFLGLSAKATKTSGDIGFKNPGMGTVEKSLGLALKPMLDSAVTDIVAKYKLPMSSNERKKVIRSKPQVKAKTEALGSELLSKMRDVMYDKLKTYTNAALIKYLLTDWIDADVMQPPYVKVTGMGSKPPYKAVVFDPLNNEKLKALNNYKLELVKVGNESIGVRAGKKQILKMRFKFESEKLASSIKLSGDPW